MKKIIFIDDNFADIKSTYYRKCVRVYDSKFEILHFLQPEYAAEYINSLDTAIIILDIMFAGDGIYKGGFKRGIDAYIEYKKNHPSIPIIILTHLERNKDVDDFTVDFIEKNEDLFLEKIATSVMSYLI